MAIILDADVVIGGERRTFDLGRWAASLPDEEFSIAAVTVAELWHGVERASGIVRTRRERYLRAVLEPLPILPYTEQTAFEHARIWAALEVSGHMIGYYDLIVAATGLEHGSSVATFNHRRLSKVPGLKIIVPT